VHFKHVLLVAFSKYESAAQELQTIGSVNLS